MLYGDRANAIMILLWTYRVIWRDLLFIWWFRRWTFLKLCSRHRSSKKHKELNNLIGDIGFLLTSAKTKRKSFIVYILYRSMTTWSRKNSRSLCNLNNINQDSLWPPSPYTQKVEWLYFEVRYFIVPLCYEYLCNLTLHVVIKIMIFTYTYACVARVMRGCLKGFSSQWRRHHPHKTATIP